MLSYITSGPFIMYHTVVMLATVKAAKL